VSKVMESGETAGHGNGRRDVSGTSKNPPIDARSTLPAPTIAA